MTVSVGLGVTEQVSNIAKRAGREIMKIYETSFQTFLKNDQTPVTDADRNAEALIVQAIKEGITSEWPIVAEESVHQKTLPDIKNSPFWLIDPLDGTKEFINRNGEFTVNIALIDNHEPILGVVHTPVTDETYVGFKDGAFLQKGEDLGIPISVRQPPKTGLTAIVSRSHLNDASKNYLQDYHIAEIVHTGSSLKFCKIASGKADIYPRLSTTMEWDTAAGHAVLKFAGGNVTSITRAPLTYGKPGFKNPSFVAFSPFCKNFIKNSETNQ